MTLQGLAMKVEARAGVWAPALAVVLHLALGFILYSSSGPDDVHITYGAAKSLLEHGAITNYNGDPIEQSSSLAHVLLTALFARVSGASVVTVGHLVPIVAGAACLPLVYRLALRVAPRAPVATTLFVATMPYFVDWTFGGLEGPLYALATLLAASTAATYLERGGRRSLVQLGLAFTFAAMARPEGMLVSLLAMGGLVGMSLVRARAWKTGGFHLRDHAPELAALGAAAVAALITCSMHFAIGRHLFPNPVLAKARGLAIGDGVAYLWSCIPWTWWWAVAAFVAGVDAVMGRVNDARADGAAERTVALLAVAYVAFIVTSGGDWMWGGRFLANVGPLLGVMIAVGVLRVARPPVVGPVLCALLLLGNVPATLFVAGGSRTGRPMWVVAKMRELVLARYPGRQYAWFELASGVSLRDIPVSEALSDILDRVAAARGGRPIVVASRQSGFTIFHALERPHPPVRFIDLENLATADFVPCADKFLLRDTKGALLPVQVLVHPPAELAGACHLERPDIIFGASHAADVKAVTGAGYTLVFRQRGQVGADPWTNGHYSAFIAVDTELAKAAKLEPTLNDPLDFEWADACALILHRTP
jgi:hypothetical protein